MIELIVLFFYCGGLKMNIEKESREFRLWDNIDKKIVTVTAFKIGSEWMAICPKHNDTVASLAINEEKGVYFCHATGCGFKGKIFKRRVIAATYDYIGEDGNLAYQVLRYQPKNFSFRRPNGHGGWINNIDGIKKIPYKLPQLLQSSKDVPVYVLEGQKDVNTLRSFGFTATTLTPLGKEWDSSLNKYFEGRDIVLLPDNDGPGREYSYIIGSGLSCVANSIKILELPGLGHKEDVTNWFEKGGSKDKLLELAKNASVYTDTPDLEKFDARFYSDLVIKKYNIGCDESKRLWLYDSSKGIWVVDAESDLKSILRKDILSREHLKKYYVTEVIEDIKDMTFKRYSFSEPDPYLVAFNDKIYDLRSDRLLDYSPEYHFINKLSVNIDTKNRECPLVEKIFAEMVSEQYKDLLFELSAYCMLRIYPYHKIFFIYGEGRNGKSTFIHILTGLLGEENVSFIDLNELSINKFATSQLYGKLANVCGELDMNILKRTGILKKLTGADTIKSEKKFKEPINFRSYAKIINMTNKLPETQDRTDAFYDRVGLIEFPYKFKGKNADSEILNKISKQEYEGYAWKCIEMLRILKERGFVMSNDYTTEQLREIYDRLSSPLGKYLEEYIVNDSFGEIASEEFSAAFSIYLTGQNIPYWPTNRINKEMRERGYELRTKAVTEDGRSTTKQFWVGLRWK